MLSVLKIGAVVFAAVTASAAGVLGSVDRKVVGLGEVVHYTLSVESDGNAQVEPPQFPNVPGLEFINASTGSETRSTYTNGRFITKQSRTFTYQLVAQKKGRVAIPSIPVKVDGYVQRTAPFEITVTEAGAGGGGQARGRRPPDPFGGFDEMDQMEQMFNQMLQRNLGRGQPRGGAGGGGGDQKPVNDENSFFIQATTDKTKAYVGEQITTNFYLVTRGQVRDIDTLRYPDLKGFWKEDLEMATRLNFENVVIDGVQWQRALLVSYALFPIKAGRSVVDGYKAKCTVVTPASFGFGRALQFTKTSTAIPIEVLEIPAPKPADFTGAVGTFRVTAQFEPATGSVGQPVTLRVRFEGKGNAKLIELPKLNLPPSFEIYETKSQAKYVKDGSSFKEFEVLIIPRQPGRFDVAPVTMSTFDSETKSFAQIGSQPLDISVTGQAAAAAAPEETSNAATAKVADPNEPRPPELAGEVGGRPVDPRTLKIITALIYAAVALFLGITTFRRLRARPRKATLAAIVRRRIETSRALMNQKEWRRAGVELTNTVYYILGQLSEQGGASQDLARLLEFTPPSLRAELAHPLRDLLTRCEALSFAPERMLKDLTANNGVETLLTDFDRIVNRAIELAEI